MTHRVTEGKRLLFYASIDGGPLFWERPWTCSCGESGVSRGASRVREEVEVPPAREDRVNA